MKKDHKSKFKTPEGYFDSFHDRLMDKIQQEETVSETSIIPKSDGFGVPEGYFDSLTNEVVAKADQKEVKVVQLKTYKRYFYGAASIAAVFLLFLMLNTNNDTSLDFDDLASAEITAYFDDVELGLSSYELAEAIPANELTLNDVLENGLEDENILEYLDENVADIEDLNLDYEDYEDYE
ncbi:hypothetical protein [Flagellimonas onchidii]|uniref:hypothetical protein n=1 Tax=Flagellimonas onchidii TaxID=2562684 RepID=UPI0010A6152E|nr:hypothetical protein [Allomuricauda onchidii]